MGTGGEKDGKLVHLCKPGCCLGGREEAVAKVQHWAPKCLAALQPRVLCRDNWLAWTDAFCLCGWMMACHGFFEIVFSRTLARSELSDAALAVQEAEENDDAFEEKIVWIRKEAARHRQLSLTWVSNRQHFDELYILRRALVPQKSLMERLASLVSVETELRDLSKEHEGVGPWLQTWHLGVWDIDLNMSAPKLGPDV